MYRFRTTEERAHLAEIARARWQDPQYLAKRAQAEWQPPEEFAAMYAALRAKVGKGQARRLVEDHARVVARRAGRASA